MNRRRAVPLVILALVGLSILVIPPFRRALGGLVDGASAPAVGTAGGADGAFADADREDESAGDGTRLRPLPVSGVVVTRAPFVLTVRASGRAEALRRSVISSRVTERVTAVHVTEGDRVEEGALLVSLDERPFRIALREAAAKRASAEVDHRMQVLDTDGDATRRELAAHRSGLTAAEQAIARAELDLASTRIRAPFAGEIARVDADLGALATQGQPILALVDLHEVRVPAEVLESDFGRLTPGARARARFAAYPGKTFTGRVTALSPELDAATGTGVAYVSIENRAGRIRPGMYADVEIDAGRFGDRISVPRRAVLERDRKLLVFRANAGRAEWQYVTIGLETEDAVEIDSGLAPGDTVLVGGHITLAHGAPIRVSLGAADAAR